MNAANLQEYVFQKIAVTEDLPFGDSVLVFRVAHKIFALTNLDAEEFSVNLKGKPEDNIRWREDYPDAVFSGYHMNKKHWNTVFPNREIPSKLFFKMVDDSYELVISSLPKKLQDVLKKVL